MTALKEKLEHAGVDTLGAQLTTALIEGLRLNPHSAVDAWRHAGVVFGYELARKLMNDMQGEPKDKEPKSPSTPTANSHYVGGAAAKLAAKPYAPRVIPKERIEQRRKLQEIVRSKYKNSGGIAWSEVGWHELNYMTRDGKEAAALMAAGPANVPNTEITVGAVLGLTRIDEIIGNIRKGTHEQATS